MVKCSVDMPDSFTCRAETCVHVGLDGKIQGPGRGKGRAGHGKAGKGRDGLWLTSMGGGRAMTVSLMCSI